MNHLRTTHLELRGIDIAEAERIVARRASSDDHWAEDFPFEGDVGAVGAFLRATREVGEQRPFGYYLITRSSDGRAIGGVGFKGPPVDGCVEIGYGLAPSARGRGYGAEAVRALVKEATDHGLLKVTADTTSSNIPSQHTLLRAGFRYVGTQGELLKYEVILNVAS